MACMASTRFLVQSSRASGKLQLQRSQSGSRNVASGPAAAAPCGNLYTYSARHRRAASSSLSKDLSVLASLQSTKAYEGPISQEEGWSTSELLSAALFATVATGGFLYGSTLSASPAPKLIHRGGGGGGHGGGGSGGSSIPASTVKEEEEERHVLVSNDDKGGPYQVSESPILVSFTTDGITNAVLLIYRSRSKPFEAEGSLWKMNTLLLMEVDSLPSLMGMAVEASVPFLGIASTNS